MKVKLKDIGLDLESENIEESEILRNKRQEEGKRKKHAVIVKASLEKYDGRVTLILELKEERYKRVDWKISSMDAIQTLFDEAKVTKMEELVGTPMVVYIDECDTITGAEVDRSLVWRSKGEK